MTSSHLPLMSPPDPIPLFRRQLALSTLLQNGLLILAGLSVLLTLLPGGISNIGFYALSTIAVLWIYLGYRSVRVSRATTDIPPLIAAGDFARAEDLIASALRGFSLFRAARLMGMHQLVVLRHAQHRYVEAVTLARVLLQQKLGNVRSVSNPTQILLAESLLELGDLPGAHAAILDLYDRRLSLGEALALLRVQLDYLARIGAWDEMLRGLPDKIRLCELMPAPHSARSQALLALAAHRTNHPDLSIWLRDRAALLSDPKSLAADRPILAEIGLA